VGFTRFHYEKKTVKKQLFRRREATLNFAIYQWVYVQQLMHTVLSGLVGTKALIYLDIVIWSATLEEHNQRLEKVFDCLWVQSLKLEPDKCEFLRMEVFWEYKVTADGVAMDERKTAAIKNYPVPTNTKQLKAFLGLAGFYKKFIP
jgi:hypothetical protein